jgi:hypothetical protein
MDALKRSIANQKKADHTGHEPAHPAAKSRARRHKAA